MFKFLSYKVFGRIGLSVVPTCVKVNKKNKLGNSIYIIFAVFTVLWRLWLRGRSGLYYFDEELNLYLIIDLTNIDTRVNNHFKYIQIVQLLIKTFIISDSILQEVYRLQIVFLYKYGMISSEFYYEKT